MSDEVIERLSREVPLVLVNRQIPGLPCVLMDVAGGARQAIEHLVDLGHRSIALLGGPHGSWTSREIRKSAASAARSGGAELTVLGPNQPTVDGGLAVAEKVAQANVTAVLAYNDLVAIGLLEGLDGLGIKVPGQISVIGIDDIEMAQRVRPKLTTVSNPTASAGRTAVDMLLQLGDDRRVTAQVSLRTELVVRDSTGPGPFAAGAAEDAG